MDIGLRKLCEECQLPFIGDTLSKAQLFLAGVLVLVINYTGDRIHFGLATERARREGIKVQQHSPATPSDFSVSLSSPTFSFSSLLLFLDQFFFLYCSCLSDCILFFATPPGR